MEDIPQGLTNKIIFRRIGYMNKQTMQFATVTENEVIAKVGKSTILQPKTNFKGGSIKWADDRKLLKSKKS